MSEMVERVAMTLATPPRWSSMHEAGRSTYRNLARDVIEAMREPTEAMTRAAYRDDAPLVVWRDMIDEALK